MRYRVDYYSSSSLHMHRSGQHCSILQPHTCSTRTNERLRPLSAVARRPSADVAGHRSTVLFPRHLTLHRVLFIPGVLSLCYAGTAAVVTHSLYLRAGYLKSFDKMCTVPSTG